MDFRYPFSVGLLVTLAGAFWDAYRHLNGLATDESLWNPFLNPAHGTVYGGAAIVAASIVLLQANRLALPTVLGRVKYVMLLGVALLLAGGLYDFWWHNVYGFADTTAFTPSHMTATAGFVVVLASGIVGLWRRSPNLVKMMLALSVTLFVGLWTMVLALT